MSNNTNFFKLFAGVVLCLPFMSLAAPAAPDFAANRDVAFKDPTRPALKKIVVPAAAEPAPIIEEIVETVRPRRPVKPKPRSLVLNYVLVSDQRRRAVINGQLLREGQSVAGARVIKISLNGVTVRRFGRTQKLTLVRASVKRRASRWR